MIHVVSTWFCEGVPLFYLCCGKSPLLVFDGAAEALVPLDVRHFSKKFKETIAETSQDIGI